MTYQDTREQEPKPLTPEQIRARVLSVAVGNINFVLPETVATLQSNSSANQVQDGLQVEQTASYSNHDELAMRRASNEAQSIATPAEVAKEVLNRVPEAA